MENKDITINELAVMLKNGFDGVDKRFDGVFDYVNKGFKQVDERFKQVDEGFNQVNSRLDRLENNQRAILARLEDVVYKTKLDQLKERVKIIEQAIALKSN